MADEASLYHEVKKLIALRKSHSALLSRGELELVYVEKDLYPLAYLRYDDNEKLLVIVNPADREVSFACDMVPEETICVIGQDVKFADGKVTVAGKSGVVVAVK